MKNNFGLNMRHETRHVCRDGACDFDCVGITFLEDHHKEMKNHGLGCHVACTVVLLHQGKGYEWMMPNAKSEVRLTYLRQKHETRMHNIRQEYVESMLKLGVPRLLIPNIGDSQI